MRWKALAAAGTAALLLSGCSQAAAVPETVMPADPGLPAYPATEALLGAMTGSSDSGVESTFGPYGNTVAAYLKCSSEGLLSLSVAGSGPVSIVCGTSDAPTRTLFEDLTAGGALTVTVEAVDTPVTFGIVFTDAG